MPFQTYDTNTIPKASIIRLKIEALSDKPAIELLAQCVRALGNATESPVRVTARSVSAKTLIRVSDDLVKAGYITQTEGNVILITIP